MDLKTESVPTNDISENSMIIQKFSILPSKNPSRRSSISQRRLSLKPQVNNTNRIQPKIDNKVVNNPPENKTQLGLEKSNKQQSEALNSTINSKQLGLQTNDIENQATLHLLDKIRHSASAEPIGPMPLSLQACRFELPFDLKLLEKLTPLDYLSKYCRLSSRRQYQFKRIFDKYRNRNYQFESSYLYLSLLDIHKHHLTHENFNYLCQLIDLNNEIYQFTYDTYVGILTLFERILYKSSLLYKDQDDHNLTKDVIEKCDFYSLDRKFDGLIISDTMKQLLNAL